MDFRKNKAGKSFPIQKSTVGLNKKLIEDNKKLLLEQENQLKALQKLQKEEVAALKKIDGSLAEMKALRLKQSQARVALRLKGKQERKAQRKKRNGKGHVWGHFLSQERKGKAEKWGEWVDE